LKNVYIFHIDKRYPCKVYKIMCIILFIDIVQV